MAAQESEAIKAPPPPQKKQKIICKWKMINKNKDEWIKQCISSIHHKFYLYLHNLRLKLQKHTVVYYNRWAMSASSFSLFGWWDRNIRIHERWIHESLFFPSWRCNLSKPGRQARVSNACKKSLKVGYIWITSRHWHLFEQQNMSEKSTAVTHMEPNRPFPVGAFTTNMH